MPTPQRRPPTLASVAESAGVSIATASKVLNGRNDVAPDTRARVEDVLRRHNYVSRRPRPATPAVATERWSLQLMFHGDINSYGIEVLQGVLSAGAAAGVDVVVSQHHNKGADLTAAWVDGLVAARRRAVIAVVEELTPVAVRSLARAHLPLVVIDPLTMPDARLTSVGSTNFAGGLAATRHLLGLGHRRIGYVGGPGDAACNQARMQGYRAAMEAAGAPVLPGYLRNATFRYDDGVVEGGSMLDLPERPTAVFAGSDEMATGVIEAARARGLSVPGDLSVVGFDDTMLAGLTAPRLTTVRQPLREMGGMALRTALRLAAGEDLDSNHVELATELVVRESTAPPPPVRQPRRPRRTSQTAS